MKLCKYCGHKHKSRGNICIVCKNGLFRYNMNRLDQMTLYEKQNKVCALCLRSIVMFQGKGSNTGCIDHCHVTNKVRGILCYQCNTYIGYLERNVSFSQMQNYLQGVA